MRVCVCAWVGASARMRACVCVRVCVYVCVWEWGFNGDEVHGVDAESLEN